MTILCWQWLRQYPTGVGSLLYTSMVWTWQLDELSRCKMRGDLQVGSFYTGRQICCHSHSLPLPSCGTKADFKGSSVSDPITSDSLDWIFSFPVGLTAKSLRLCKILTCHLHVAFAPHSSHDHLCKKTYWVSKQSNLGLPIPNIWFRNLRARLA